MATSPCPHCAKPNDDGARFCTHCGASLTPQVHCPGCNSLVALGTRFCSHCGTSLAQAGWTGPAVGGVSEGVWERGPDELVRRVEPEDARHLLGARVVRVPPGSVGVIVVDGVVERVLPAGERTSLSLFERATNFFLKRERSAFYLVELRPVSIPFIVQGRPGKSGRLLRTQILVSFFLPRGDHARLSTFLTHAVGPRTGFGAMDLFHLVRADVARIAESELDRLVLDGDDARGAGSLADAEAKIRQALQDQVGPRYGLAIDLSVAPLTKLQSKNLVIGAGDAVVTTADGQRVELDLALRVQGQHEDFSVGRLEPALTGASAAHLRRLPWSELATEAGCRSLETALKDAIRPVLDAFGLVLVELGVVDLRSQTGQWLLGARADLAQKEAELAIRRETAALADGDIDLAALVSAQALRRQSIEREARLATRVAEIAAARSIADAERLARTGGRLADLDDQGTLEARERELALSRRDARHGDQRAERELQLESKRRELELEVEQRRARIELERLAEQAQIEKLRAMAALDQEIAATEHAHTLEKREQLRDLAPDAMIAAQALDLARSGQGDAWAQALAAGRDAEAERRHAEALGEVFRHALGAMGQVAASRAEASPIVAVPTVAAVSATSPMPPVTSAASPSKSCTACGIVLRPDARFCAACGAAQDQGPAGP